MKKFALCYLFIAYVILIANSLAVFSQDKRFVAETNKNSVSVGEQVQITFTLENASGRDFKPPQFSGFSILGGPHQSHSTQIINGAITRSTGFTFLLRAEVEGTHRISPATINADGDILSSNPITITAGKAQAKQESKTDSEQSLEQQANEIISKNLFIRMNVNKTNVFLGEVITVDYKLYIHPELSLVNMAFKKPPTFNGFWSQDIDLGRLQIKPGTEIVDGVRYRIADLKQSVLIPQRTGELVIDPLEMEFVVRLQVQQPSRSRSRDPFSDFWDNPFGRASFQDFNYIAKSRTTTINVRALPDNAPAEFNGAVGSFRMEVKPTEASVKQNEPVNLSIRLSGRGNLKLLQIPDLKLPSNIDKFEPTTLDNINVSANGMSGNIAYDLILIPRMPGEFILEPVKFAYFDLDSRQYVSLSSEPITIKVEKGIADPALSIALTDKQDVKLLSDDIRFIKTNDITLKKADNLFFGSLSFWALSLCPLLAFFVLLLVKRNQKNHAENIGLYRQKNAYKLAKKRLSSAQKLLAHNDDKLFYQEISKGLWGYISHKFSLPNSSLTKDSVEKVAKEFGITEEQFNELFYILDYCEYIRFAPNQDLLERSDIYERSIEIIAKFEEMAK